MSTPSPEKVAGLVLAGGRSSRMGRDKVFVSLRERPLASYAIARLVPQVGPVAIVVNGDPKAYLFFQLPVLSDEVGARNGPLAGIYVGLKFARSRSCELLAVVPADAPFLPTDLVARLEAARGPNEIAAAQSPQGLEPLFSLWPTATLEAVAERLAQQRYAVADAIRSLPHCSVPFMGCEPDPFLNVNRPADLAKAERLLGGSAAPGPNGAN